MAGQRALEPRPDDPPRNRRRDAAEPVKDKGSAAGDRDLDGDPEQQKVVLEHLCDGLAGERSLDGFHCDERRNLDDGQSEGEGSGPIFRGPMAPAGSAQVAEENGPQGCEPEDRPGFDREHPVAVAALGKDLCAEVGVREREHVAQPMAHHCTDHGHSGQGQTTDGAIVPHFLVKDIAGCNRMPRPPVKDALGKTASTLLGKRSGRYHLR
jgi:hypothetical protein